MAKIGLKNFLFGILTEESDGSATYGVAHKPARAISCNVEITNNDASLYADDALAESDKSFQSASVTMGLDYEDLEMFAMLLGHTIDNGEVVRSNTDTAPYVGLGRVVTKMIRGAYYYKVEFLKKVKFAEPSQEDSTKGETLEFATYELEGTASTLADGTWSVAKTFNDFDDAMEYLQSFFAVAPTTYTVTYDLNGGTGSLEPEVVTIGESVTLNNGAGVTPPENLVFNGWATTAEAVEPNVTSPYTPTGDITIYAVYGES